MSSGVDYAGGGGAAANATKTLAIDASRPIAYWGYLDKTSTNQYIRKLDYTVTGFPVVTVAQVNSVLADWTNRTTLIYV